MYYMMWETVMYRGHLTSTTVQCREIRRPVLETGMEEIRNKKGWMMAYPNVRVGPCYPCLPSTVLRL